MHVNHYLWFTGFMLVIQLGACSENVTVNVNGTPQNDTVTPTDTAVLPDFNVTDTGDANFILPSEDTDSVSSDISGDLPSDTNDEDTLVPPQDTFVPPEDTGTIEDTSPPPQDTSLPQDTATPPDTTSPPTKGYSNPCTSGNECIDNYCVGDPSDTTGTKGACTIACKTKEGICPDPQHECVDTGQGYVCNPFSPNQPIGETCTDLQSADCAWGLSCLQNLQTPDNNYCTLLGCQNQKNCPAGFACHHPQDSTPSYCVDVGRSCTAGGTQCWETGLCLQTTQNISICTAVCLSHEDCPNGFGCSEEGYCITNQTGGQIGAPCDGTAQNNCQSGTCVTFEPSMISVCSDLCLPDTGCPKHFACIPAEGTYVCVPKGSGHLGDVCTQTIHCKSGLCECPDANCTTPGFCSSPCSALTPCPVGWTCQPGLTTTVCMPVP